MQALQHSLKTAGLDFEQCAAIYNLMAPGSIGVTEDNFVAFFMARAQWLEAHPETLLALEDHSAQVLLSHHRGLQQQMHAITCAFVAVSAVAAIMLWRR